MKSKQFQILSELLYFIYPAVSWKEKKKCWKEGPRNKMMYSKSIKNETRKTDLEHQNYCQHKWDESPWEVLCTFNACKVGYTTQISALKRQELQHGSSPWCNIASQWQTERWELSNPCPGTVQPNSSDLLHFAIIELLRYHHTRCQPQMTKPPDFTERYVFKYSLVGESSKYRCL